MPPLIMEYVNCEVCATCAPGTSEFVPVKAFSAHVASRTRRALRGFSGTIVTFADGYASRLSTQNP